MTQNTNTFHDLPTLEFKDVITDAVDRNQVVILAAETGAGKSTQVPQYLAEHGYERIIVTQPRILAARNLMKRVREEWSERHAEDASEIIGYRTAHERDDSGQTKILYCTDGLQMVRELTGIGVRKKQILVLDEVHEWNENMEVLIAWAKKRVQEDPGFKVLVMSATIETESLAEYYGTTAVISIPGRYFPVTKRVSGDLMNELRMQLDERTGRNVLVFLPGKAEIQNSMDAFGDKALEAGVPLIPLHSQLEVEDQQKAFASYPNGKIILSTNIAQTSVTIDDIDLVIDSGLERRSEVRSGVEGLFMAQISQADSLQRAGRAGRTRPGEYVLAALNDMPCASFEDRPAYPTPEILRKHIDRLTLRLANIGMDIEDLDFYHDPSKAAIRRAKRTLVGLGAMTYDGKVTHIGQAMEHFPVESSFGRMLVEVQKEDEAVRGKLATMIAIQEVGGIVRSSVSGISWRSLTGEKQSDFLAQYDVYRAALELSDEDREAMGIVTKQIDKATEVRERLYRDLGLVLNEPESVIDGERQALIRAIIAGQLHQIWQVNERGQVEHIQTGDVRNLSKTTVVMRGKLLAGAPFDLEVPMRGGDLETLHLVQDVTEVPVDILTSLMPNANRKRGRQLTYDPRLGGLAWRERVQFGKKVLMGAAEPVEEHTAEHRKAFVREYSKWAYEKMSHQQRTLRRFHRKVPNVALREVEQEVKRSANGIVSLHELSPSQKRHFLALANLETYLGDDFMQRLGDPRRNSPHKEKRRRGWMPRHKRR